MKQTVITSSHGELHVAEDGTIVKRERYDVADPDLRAQVQSVTESAFIDQITAFDLAEWRTNYNQTELPSHLDILDIGYWLAAPGKPLHYEPPVAEWRAEYQSSYLDTYLMTDQPPTCPKCGRRVHIISGATTDKQICRCPGCSYKYRLQADDEEEDTTPACGGCAHPNCGYCA